MPDSEFVAFPLNPETAAALREAPFHAVGNEVRMHRLTSDGRDLGPARIAQASTAKLARDIASAMNAFVRANDLDLETEVGR